MESPQSVPTSLKVVAWLFILGGICSAIEVIVSIMHNHVNINFGVLGIFIGRGLLRLRPGWRTCALVFLWLAMIGVPIATLLMLTRSGPLDFKLFGQKVGHASKELGVAVAVIVFFLSIWEYRVLTRADIRGLFRVDAG